MFTGEAEHTATSAGYASIVLRIQWYPSGILSLTPAGMCWKCRDTGMFTGEAEHNATCVGHTCLYSSSEGILQCYKCGTCLHCIMYQW